MDFLANTQRFKIRNLIPEDVGEAYLSWFQQPDTTRFLVHKNTGQNHSELVKYVREKSLDPKVLFVGIFDRETNEHIGNIKYEPLDFVQKLTCMGILIGSPAYRGKGVATEVLPVVHARLGEMGISTIYLGVKIENVAAVKAYKKVGFKEVPFPTHIEGIYFDGSGIAMALEMIPSPGTK